MIPLATELAEMLEGQLIALYQDETRREDGVHAIIDIPQDGNLIVVLMPVDAKSLDDLPENAEDFPSGIALLKSLDGVTFGNDKSRAALYMALSSVDRQRSMRVAAEWAKFAAEKAATLPLPG